MTESLSKEPTPDHIPATPEISGAELPDQMLIFENMLGGLVAGTGLVLRKMNEDGSIEEVDFKDTEEVKGRLQRHLVDDLRSRMNNSSSDS